MACFLPVRPWVFPGPSGFPPLAAPTASFENRGDSPLLHFDATLSVLLLRLPRPSPSHVDHDPKRIVPRVSFVALQHFRTREPFFSLPLSRQRRRNVALFLRSLTRGFGYPFDEMAWLPNPWGSFSTPNARGLRSSELFSFRVIEKPSRALSPLLRFLAKPFDLAPALQRVCPTWKAVPLVAPECLARVGTVALLSFPTSQALPPATLGKDLLRLFHPLPLF
jgi:hypothetical protein